MNNGDIGELVQNLKDSNVNTDHLEDNVNLSLEEQSRNKMADEIWTASDRSKNNDHMAVQIDADVQLPLE